MIRKLLATKEIYSIVSKVVRERAASGKPGNDTLQMLLDCGDEELIIIGVCVVFNTGALTNKDGYSLLWDYSSLEQGRLGRRVSNLLGAEVFFPNFFPFTRLISVLAFHIPWGSSILEI